MWGLWSVGDAEHAIAGPAAVRGAPNDPRSGEDHGNIKGGPALSRRSPAGYKRARPVTQVHAARPLAEQPQGGVGASRPSKDIEALETQEIAADPVAVDRAAASPVLMPSITVFVPAFR